MVGSEDSNEASLKYGTPEIKRLDTFFRSYIGSATNLNVDWIEPTKSQWDSSGFHKVGFGF
jgi:hypothetical protein